MLLYPYFTIAFLVPVTFRRTQHRCCARYVYVFVDRTRQDRYLNIVRTFYAGASGAIIVFDQTSQESFKKALDWKNDVASKRCDIPIVVAQNKSDLQRHAGIPTGDTMKAWVNDNGKRSLSLSQAFVDSHMPLLSSASSCAAFSTALFTCSRFLSLRRNLRHTRIQSRHLSSVCNTRRCHCQT